MSISKQLAIPTTLTDLLKARNDALRLIEDARRSIVMAEDLLEQYGRHLMPYSARQHGNTEQIRCEIDRRMWSRAFDLTGFKTLMDSKAIKEFEDSLERKVPEFTEGTIRSTFLELYQTADEMFRRGVFNVFRQLPSGYRTNQKEPFRIGRKVITYMVSLAHGGGLEIRYGQSSDRLNDIDRVFKTLDEKPFTPRSLEVEMNAALKKHEVFENEYYRARGFRNGNMHLEFKRLDLLEKVNELIAEHYGKNIIPDARCA